MAIYLAAIARLAQNVGRNIFATARLGQNISGIGWNAVATAHLAQKILFVEILKDNCLIKG